MVSIATTACLNPAHTLLSIHVGVCLFIIGSVWKCLSGYVGTVSASTDEVTLSFWRWTCRWEARGTRFAPPGKALRSGRYHVGPCSESRTALGADGDASSFHKQMACCSLLGIPLGWLRVHGPEKLQTWAVPTGALTPGGY